MTISRFLISRIPSQDSVIQKARVQSVDDAFHVTAAPKDHTAVELARMDLDGEEDDFEAEEAMRSLEQVGASAAAASAAAVGEPLAEVAAPEKELHSFEIDASQVGSWCLHPFGSPRPTHPPLLPCFHHAVVGSAVVVCPRKWPCTRRACILRKDSSARWMFSFGVITLLPPGSIHPPSHLGFSNVLFIPSLASSTCNCAFIDSAASPAGGGVPRHECAYSRSPPGRCLFETPFSNVEVPHPSNERRV